MEQNTPDTGLCRQALREHGHGFHYAVIRRIERATQQVMLGWRFVAAEVPLELNGVDVHADFLFEASNRYLIGECKRVNPTYSEWLFAQTSYRTGGSARLRPTVEELYVAPGSALQVRPFEVAGAEHAFQVGVSVHAKRKGEGCVSDKTAIEEATKQVSRAAGGFSQLCRDNGALLPSPARIIPVIFTTAKLAVCNQALELSNLATGDLDESAAFSYRPWVWYQRGLTPSLRANLQGRYVSEDSPTWARYFSRSALRSVAIVNEEGIGEFLVALDQWM